MGVLTQIKVENFSHTKFKWTAQVLPNFTAWDEWYKQKYEGTGKNMFICVPEVFGEYPDWLTGEQKWYCGNYTPQLTAHVHKLKEFSYVYNKEKPLVNISIGLATVITSIGVPGKTLLNFQSAGSAVPSLWISSNR